MSVFGSVSGSVSSMRWFLAAAILVASSLAPASRGLAAIEAASVEAQVGKRVPRGITVPPVSEGLSFTVTWRRARLRPKAYLLQEATDPQFQGGLRNVHRGLKRQVLITGRQNGQRYYYRVRAIGRNYRSRWVTGANECLVNRTAAPPASIAVPATSASPAYQVQWGGSATAGVTYELEEAVDPGFTSQLRLAYSGGGLAADITDRVNGTTYFYRVRATGSEWHPSAWVEGASGCPVSWGDSTPPGPVTGFTAAPVADRVELSWVNPSEPDFGGVRVRRRSDRPPADADDGEAVCDVPGQSCTDSGLSTGFQHYAAFVYDADSNFSAAATADAYVGAENDCIGCHNGNPDHPLAPNVVDGPLPGSPGVSYNWFGTGVGNQAGGHGDPQYRDGTGRVAVCTDCHDLTRPDPGNLHLNGVLESVFDEASRNRNTAHLIRDYINAGPADTWDVQVTFDSACWTRCHAGNGVPDMRHSRDSNPAATAVRFGDKLSIANGRTIGYPIDSDLTDLAPTATPDFALCVTCHEPHGTTVNESGKDSNRMLRSTWTNVPTLCLICHR